MSPELVDFIASLHASPVKTAIVTTGGAAQLASWLLSVPGASNTVLEARKTSNPALQTWCRLPQHHVPRTSVRLCPAVNHGLRTNQPDGLSRRRSSERMQRAHGPPDGPGRVSACSPAPPLGRPQPHRRSGLDLRARHRPPKEGGSQGLGCPPRREAHGRLRDGLREGCPVTAAIHLGPLRGRRSRGFFSIGVFGGRKSGRSLHFRDGRR